MITTPGLLSVMLPGLGQLFQLRILRAALVFLVFALCIVIGKTQTFLPLVSLLAGLDAHKFTQIKETSRQRTYLYFSVGLICFFAWVGLFAGRIWT